MGKVLWLMWSVLVRLWNARGRIVEAVLTFLGWLYLARVSVLGLALFLGLPIGAREFMRALAIGVFDLENWLGALMVGVMLPVAAWAIFLSAAMVFAYGQERARFDLLPVPGWVVPGWRLALAAGALINLWTIFAATAPMARLGMVGWVLGGFGLSLAAIGFVEAFYRRRLRGTAFSGIYLLSWSFALPGTGKQIRDVPPDPWDWLKRGYQKWGDGGWEWVPGHGLLGIGAAFFALLNLAIFEFTYDSLGQFTALVYLLVMVTTAVLVAGGVSFFLDAYRLPFISVCIVWLWLIGHKPNCDHYYRVWPREGGVAKEEEVLTPAQVLGNAVAAERPIVLVAISGGGIQSGAWGLRVLTGLEEVVQEAQKRPEIGSKLPDFAASVQCLSGISGGAVGAMYFAAGYGEGGLPPPRKKGVPQSVDSEFLRRMLEAGEGTSLGQAVWGLAYPDLRRALFPFFIDNDYRDRAEKMEIRWAEYGAQMGPQGASLKNASLVDWQRDVREGVRPATIFSGTMVETGGRISFSTAPPRAPFAGQREFVTASDQMANVVGGQLYPGADLRITTAARLSATFPVISPAARPLVTRGREAKGGALQPAADLAKIVPGFNGLRHVVDGGYYENTGLGALAQWLDNGLSELATSGSPNFPKSVLILQMDGFPAAPRVEEGPPQMQSASERGTLYQIGSPLEALYNVRGTGHTASADRLMEVLQQRWKSQPAEGARTPICNIQVVRFTIPIVPHDVPRRQFWEPAWGDAKPDQPPLSWHLREAEKCEIESGWQAFRNESLLMEPPTKPSDGNSASHAKGPYDVEARPIDRVLEFLSASAPAMSAKSAAQSDEPNPPQ